MINLIKNILIINLLLLILSENKVFAQNNYKPNPETKKFAGKWQWIQNTDTLILLLKNNENVTYFNSQNHTDLISDFLTYTKQSNRVFTNEKVIPYAGNSAKFPLNLWAHTRNQMVREAESF